MNKQIRGTVADRLRHRVTIRAIATRYGLTMKRVRYVRQHGGPFDWPAMIEAVAQSRPAPFADVSTITEYGLTQRLSFAVRCF